VRYWWRRSKVLGGGKKFVIILAANQGGGVMEWKGPREWAIERDSIRNKRKYANRWGYELEIVDMSTKKRYAHEWRESWEKVDTVRNCLRKYPDAEWLVNPCTGFSLQLTSMFTGFGGWILTPS
jgi:mannan polymerase II complex MNN10 subunit